MGRGVDGTLASPTIISKYHTFKGQVSVQPLGIRDLIHRARAMTNVTKAKEPIRTVCRVVGIIESDNIVVESR